MNPLNLTAQQQKQYNDMMQAAQRQQAMEQRKAFMSGNYDNMYYKVQAYHEEPIAAFREELKSLEALMFGLL